MVWSGIGLLYGSLWICLNKWQKLAFWLTIIAIIIGFNVYGQQLKPIVVTAFQYTIGMLPQGPNPWIYFLNLIIIASLCYFGARQLLIHYQLKR